MIDTHAHLNFQDYEKDLDNVIDRAIKNGVNKIICASSNIADSKKSIQIAEKYPGIVYATAGIHPQQTDPENTQTLKQQIKDLEKLARQKKIVAIGECGLDYSPAPPGEEDRTKNDQLFLFREQIKIAQKFNLSLIIHSRKAFSETVDVLTQPSLKSKQELRGVFHCYSAGKKGIEKVNQLGFYFGVDGNFTYDSGLQNVFAKIPIEKILLETDAPFLSPIPKRGERNEPSFMIHTAQKLAALKDLPLEKIDQITTTNTINLFGL